MDQLHKLGYLLSGPLSTCPQSATAGLFHVSMLSIKEVPNIERFWKVKAAGTTPSKKDPGKQFLRSKVQYYLSARWFVQLRVSLERESPSFTI